MRVSSVTSVMSDSLDPMDYSPPGSSVHGILQARILEWVAMPSSRGSSSPRDQTCISCTAGEFFNHWATWEAQKEVMANKFSSVQFSSVAQSRLILCNPMHCSMLGFPVHHQLPEFTQTHVHRIGDAIQPSHPLSSPFFSCLQSFPAQGLF